VTDADEFNIALDVLHEGWGMPPTPDSLLRRIRQPWRTVPGHRTVLAYADGQPAGMAMMYIEDRTAYLENASVIPRFRGRGVHSAMVRQRIIDAMALGCDTILGAASFDSPSRANQMRAGLQIGYLAAIWSRD
jgi:ribosomal protein S18 acetylase RimI-like enzyme